MQRHEPEDLKKEEDPPAGCKLTRREEESEMNANSLTRPQYAKTADIYPKRQKSARNAGVVSPAMRPSMPRCRQDHTLTHEES